MTPEVYAALDALDFLGDDYEEKAKEILAPLEIFSVTNLSEGIPTKDELKALVGKTGQALLDDGWTVWGWDLETLEYRMYHDVYTFTVLFEGDAEVTEDTDGEEILPQLVVKSVKYDGIGRATEID